MMLNHCNIYTYEILSRVKNAQYRAKRSKNVQQPGTTRKKPAISEITRNGWSKRGEHRGQGDKNLKNKYLKLKFGFAHYGRQQQILFHENSCAPSGCYPDISFAMFAAYYENKVNEFKLTMPNIAKQHHDNTNRQKRTWREALGGNVLALGVVSLFTDFSSEMIYPLLPMFIAGLVGAARPGAGSEEILAVAAVYVGTMGGLAETTSSLLKIFSGRISDAIGKRKALVVVGYGISTVARPAMALAGVAWQVVGLRVADRVGKGIRTSPRDALISDTIGPGVRGLAFSFHRVMDHTGAILGPLAGIAVLYAFLGRTLWKGTAGVAGSEEMSALRWLFAIALIPGVAAMTTIFGKVRETAPKPADRKAGKIDLSAWRRLPGRFWAYVGIVALFSLGNSSDLFLLLYGQKLFGYGLGAIIGLWIMLHISKIVFSFPGGIISDKLGRRPVIVAGWTIYALVYVGMAWLGGGWFGVSWPWWTFWLLIAAYGFYYGMTEGVEKALVADFIPSEHRGTAYGVYHGAEGAAKLPASLMFGVFWLAIGPQTAFGIGAALAAGAVVGLVILLSAAGQR